MKDKDQAVVVPMNDGDSLSEQLWDYDDSAVVGDQPADFFTGLVSLGFIKAAIRRGAWFWCTLAVIGLLAGFGYKVAFPSAYQASTSVLLPQDGQNSASNAIGTDLALAQSRAVAELTMRRLGLQQSVNSFLGTYTVTDVTDEVLLITVSAPSSNDAVRRANTLATGFLQFRANLQETEQEFVLRSLDPQVNQATQRIKSLNKQISQLSARPTSPAQQAGLGNLRTDLGQATNALSNANGNKASVKEQTTLQVKSSKVLDHAAPIPHSRKKPVLLAAAIGLIAGLALGLGIVIVRALVSDRLRGRDDIAYALGAPVKLSVGTVRLSRWWPRRRGLAAARGREIRRIIAYLSDAAPRSSRLTALALVSVDSTRVAALSLASVAVSCAQQGWQVVMADLCSGAHAARLLGATDSGVQAVNVHGAHLVVAVPESDDVMPEGPLHRGARRAEAAEPLAAACASADLVLTLAALDPSLGGDHLATWATDAVVMVTAGRSSWTKINAVGEMIRLAGMRLVSAVLVGADKTDESLGVTHMVGGSRKADVVEEGLHTGRKV